MLGEVHALARAEARERRIGSLNVVAQGGRRLAAKLEVHGEFRRGDLCPWPRSRSSVVPTLRWSCDRTAGFVRSYSAWRKSACLNEYGNSAALLSPSARGATSNNCARAISSHVWPTHSVSRSSTAASVWMRNSMPQTAAAEHQALIACELRNVMIDYGREILRKRDLRELQHGCGVVTGLRGARDHFRHHRRDEQRHAVGALVQRAHKRLIGGVRGDRSAT